MTDFAGLLRALVDGGVECILVGGVAATVHGSARLTRDVDVVYSRRPENIARVVAALAETVRVFGRDLPCLTLQMLIHVKRAAGRPRDLEAVAELEAIAEEIDRAGDRD